MSGDYCTICPKKCHWSSHQNLPYILEWHIAQETKTFEDLKATYLDAQSQKSAKEQILDGLLNDLDSAQETAMKLIERMRRCQQRLSEIALRPSVLPSAEYLTVLIDNERSGQKPGHEKRVNALLMLKRRTELIQQMADPNFDLLSDYRNNDAVKVQLEKAKTKRKGVAGWFGF